MKRDQLRRKLADPNAPPLLVQIGRFLYGRVTRLLLLAAALALLGSILLWGEAAFLSLIAFTVLLPATIISILLRWWPGEVARGREPGTSAPWRRTLNLLAGGMVVTTLGSLIAGVGLFGTAAGIMLLTTGLLLLPPGISLTLLALSMRYRFRVGGTAYDPRKQLGEETAEPPERVLYRAEVHWGVLLPAVLALLTSALLAVGPFGVVGQVIATILYVLVFPGLAAYAQGVYFDTELRVTENHLVVETGLIVVHSRVIPLSDVQALGVHYTWLGRLLGYGRVVITTRDGVCVIVPGIVDPFGIYQVVMSRVMHGGQQEPARLVAPAL
ncbi:MAG: PH domain-containing protein [Halorhodospira halophila]|uniref:PH domain-containing protein n=1 Tax=Halorhodospira TaxID=85108 RepID=UPI00191398FB|nr:MULTISPECIES: PH domain-containing protein [Halorhodospira]MCC3751414.1 PH domain-containing protein [Halorhodospira halophila]MCG5528703.1 PH domain-containing protein [Halorhodospira halophila]MCG5533900.1 PH domain-containing protein [Halorhodospira sp. 9621]MCG5539050.1 PH domain-containing protein [Halorhodospira sp. 9622]MCG5540384.1 PH domain-containing protein [Halorhodospira sp. M39old]